MMTRSSGPTEVSMRAEDCNVRLKITLPPKQSIYHTLPGFGIASTDKTWKHGHPRM
jgi:hypothetical protein